MRVVDQVASVREQCRVQPRLFLDGEILVLSFDERRGGTLLVRQRRLRRAVDQDRNDPQGYAEQAEEIRQQGKADRPHSSSPSNM